jgi:hypothetical protein
MLKVEEETLNFSKMFNYELKWREKNTCYIKINDKIKDFNILAFNEFDEIRNRMSILFYQCKNTNN